MIWSHYTFLYLLFFLFLVFSILLFIKKKEKEGFIQSSSFILKTKEDIYDTFYAQIYNTIHEPNQNADFITDIIIQDTFANTKTSVVLIIGCETGFLANQLQNKGIDTYIIDHSKQ